MVADSGGVYPDPSFKITLDPDPAVKKKLNPDPTMKKIARIRIRPSREKKIMYLAIEKYI